MKRTRNAGHKAVGPKGGQSARLPCETARLWARLPCETARLRTACLVQTYNQTYDKFQQPDNKMKESVTTPIPISSANNKFK